MVRGLGLVLVLAIGLTAAATARADGALTPADLAWLADNLNLAADSPVIATLSEAEQERRHALIGAAKPGLDRTRQAVENFITKAIGDSFEQTLHAVDEPSPAQSTELGANRAR